MRLLLCALFLCAVALTAVVATHGVHDRQGPGAVTALPLDHAHHLGHATATVRAANDPSSVASGADTTSVCRALCLALATLPAAPETARVVVGVAYPISATDPTLPASRTSLPSLRPPKVPV